MRYQYSLVRRVQIKKKKAAPSADQDTSHLEISYIAGGSAKQ